MKLIVGLGNPGKAYTYTRHNVGFLVAERLALLYKGRFQKACDGLLAQININHQSCYLLMPQTMMNNSGASVKSAITKFEVDFKDVLIVYDDVAIEFGTLRLRPNGSAGGHNGIKSILASLKTMEVARLRLGIGQAPLHVDQADYVLAKFNAGELKKLPEIINNASLAVHSWVTQEVKDAMQVVNSNKKQKDCS